MLKRTFITIVVIIPLVLLGLSIGLYITEQRHNRIIENETQAMRVLQTTYEAALLLSRQRERVAASIYLPLDRASFRARTNQFRQLISDPTLVSSPSGKLLQQQILEQYNSFVSRALALPPNPIVRDIEGVREQAGNVAELLDEMRARHALDLNALLSTERAQRELSAVVLLVTNGVVLLLVVVAFILLTRLAEQQQLAAALQARDQLRREFVAFAAHELRNPASAIKTGASMLREPDLEPEIHEKVVDSINRSADALTRVVLNLLNLDRAEAGRLRLQQAPILLSVLVDELISEMESYHPGLEGRVQRIIPRVRVNVDTEYIKLVLSNLLDNAIKYSPSHAPVYISAAPTEEGMVSVHVRDVGAGIPPEELPHIFERYETSGAAPGDRSRRGIGLGLYMARLLVEAHGGTVWAASEVGHGTTISFTIPQVPPASQRRHSMHPRSSSM
ncbi:MAG: sensor histidine kinase [Armatimonadota bacterium]